MKSKKSRARNKKFGALFLGATLLFGMLPSPTQVSAMEAISTERAAAASEALNTIGTITAIKQEGSNVFLDLSTGEKMKVSFLKDNLFRLHLDPAGVFPEYPTPNSKDHTTTIIDKNVSGYMEQYGAIKVTVDESDADIYRISTDAVELRIDKATSKMSLYDKAKSKVLWSESKPLKYENNKTVQTLDTNDNEYFFGGGQQNGYYSHKNTAINIAIGGGWDAGAASSPVPFYLSTEGYGVMRNTFKPGVYDFSETATFSHNENRFDAYYFVEESIPEIINEYTELTGKAALMPEFAFYLGHADCFNGTHNGHKDQRTLLKDAVKVIDDHADEDMPLGWILPNDGYGCGYSGLDNLEQFSEKANAGDVEVGLWTQSNLYPDPNLPENDPLRRDLDGEVKAGVRAIKTDVAWVGHGYSMALNATRQAAEGIEKEENSGGARPFIISLDGWAGTQRYASLWSGDQYGGNWEYIRMHIPTYIGAGLSGNPNVGSDVDGIFGGDKVIQTRDFQWKTFTPVEIDMDGWASGGQDYSKEKKPWNFGQPYTDINRMYLKLKAQMMPYIYTIAEESTSTSMPMIRGMMLEYPNDPYTYGTETQYQYMWGPNMLVAPVYNGDEHTAGVRNGIYLPDEDQVWIDYFTGEQYKGGVVLNNFDAPLWKTPVFVKDGAIIPMAPENNSINELDGSENRIFDVYPSGKSEFTMYEDDGKTVEYKEDKNTKTTITSEVSGDRAVITVGEATGAGYKGMVKDRGTEFLINTRQNPEQVTVKVGATEVALTEATSEEEYESLDNVYFYNEEPNFNKYSTEGSEFEETKVMTAPKLQVKVQKTDITANTVTLTVDGFNNTQVKEVVDAEIPQVPTGFKADDANVTDKEIKLEWNQVDGENTTYDLLINDVVYTNVFKATDSVKAPYYTHAELPFDTEYAYQVRAVNTKGASNWSEELNVKTKLDRYRNVPKNMSAKANSEQSGSGAAQAVDGRDDTQWHTNWTTGNKLPHTFEIDMKLAYQLDKLEYLPRPDAGNGTILKYNLDISLDGKVYKNIITDGKFVRNKDVKTIDLTDNVTARYLKLTITEAVGNFGSAQEFRPYKKDKTEGMVVGENIPNGEIDESDLLFFASYMGVDETDTAWEQVSKVDINYNGVIDAYDLMYVAGQLGATPLKATGKPIAGSLDIRPDKQQIKAGEEFTVDIIGVGLKDINAFNLELNLDPNKYEIVTACAADDTCGIVSPTNATKGMLNYSILAGVGQPEQRIMAAFSNKGSQATVEGTNTVATIKLKAKKDLNFDMAIKRSLLVNTSFATIDKIGKVLAPGEEPEQGEVDKTDLVSKIAEAQAINKEDYTQESVRVLEAAIDTAKEVVANKKATQQEVNEALAALQNAIRGLTLDGVILTNKDMTATGDGSKMQNGEAAFEKLIDGEISENSLAELKWNLTPQDGISLPLAVDFNFNKPQAVTKFEVFNRPQYTNGKIKKLSAKAYGVNGDVYDLGTKAVGATDKSVTFRVSEAVTTMPSGAKISKVTIVFEESHSGPLMLSVAEVQFLAKNSAQVDTSALASLVAKAEEKQAENYTEESWAVFSAALANGKEVLASSTSQAEIDAAFAQLTAALNGLQSKIQNVADLQKLVEEFNKAGEFANSTVARSLQVHLTAVSHYENTGATDKVVKHLKGFKDLLANLHGNKQISEKAFNDLNAHTDYLINK
ncbi:FIMAH domain-containing protein [Sporosarcina sp. NPDC096371]|uniref:FIMAH domain-containing protein n=1 Tax=Sporosarcina sp. NPDC096371 TaxID=3364530 RepID=UPI00381DC565